jgi:hypothetical protein
LVYSKQREALRYKEREAPRYSKEREALSRAGRQSTEAPLNLGGSRGH